MNVHALKCWPRPFQATWDGKKPYEVRFDDRGFRRGDVLALFEWDPAKAQYTGRLILATITYLTTDGDFGLPPQLSVLGIRVDHRIDRVSSEARAA